MSLNLTSLQSALKTLHESFIQYEKDPQNTLMRDGIRFEYCFELCWKMLQRELREEIGDDSVEVAKAYSKRDLFRLGWEQGLVKHSSSWFKYLDARNISSHAYNEQNAEAVFKIIKPFAEDADYLLQQLEQRNA